MSENDGRGSNSENGRTRMQSAKMKEIWISCVMCLINACYNINVAHGPIGRL